MWIALFQMHSLKSPRPDGMSLFFFQKFWDIVRPDVTSAVISALHSDRYLHKMNYTHIMLIPKKSNLKHIIEYRPISLGNVVSWLVLKVLANKVKAIFPNVLSNAQSTFVLGRLIIDNTTIAYEMLHSMRNKRRSKTGHLAIKLDMSKAYDQVKWCFLKQIMLKIGLPG